MALIKCPDCGKDVSDSAKNCIHCGCVLKHNLIKCPECGKDSPEGTKTCSGCGYTFNDFESVQKVVVVNNRKFFTSKKLFMIGLILFFIVSVAFLLVHFITKNQPILNASNPELLNISRETYMANTLPRAGKIFFAVSNIFRYISVVLAVILLAKPVFRKKWVTLIYLAVNILSLPYLLLADLVFTDQFYVILTGPLCLLIFPALMLQFISLFIKDKS